MPRTSSRGRVKNYSVQLTEEEVAVIDAIIAELNAVDRFKNISRNAWLRRVVLDAAEADASAGPKTANPKERAVL